MKKILTIEYIHIDENRCHH